MPVQPKGRHGGLLPERRKAVPVLRGVQHAERGRSRARAARPRAHGAVDVGDAAPGERRRRGGRRLRGHRGHDAARRALGGARRRAGLCAPGGVRRVYLWKCRVDVYQGLDFSARGGAGLGFHGF